MVEKTKIQENWDFDFSRYEGEEHQEEIVQSIQSFKRPQVTGLRSRFSLGEAELERIADLKKLSSKYSIKVETRTQDISILWKLYGVLSELWEIVRNIYGSTINTEILQIKKRCRVLMSHYGKTSSSIPPKVHNNLLFFRSQMYRLMQLSNLGFEVEKTSRSTYSRARRSITQ